jgi:hypothetical protein
MSYLFSNRSLGFALGNDPYFGSGEAQCMARLEARRFLTWKDDNMYTSNLTELLCILNEMQKN